MAFIYKIVNDINDKIYIGKTINTIEHRWKEHCRDKDKPKNSHRHLYRAMNKYGIEHFNIQEVEEVTDVTILSEREKYWINYYDSYYNGYNKTFGGDGRLRLNYEQVVEAYKRLGTCKKVSSELGIDCGSVSTIVKLYGITPRQGKHEIKTIVDKKAPITKAKEIKSVSLADLEYKKQQKLKGVQAMHKANQVSVDMYDLTDKYIMTFPSIKEASEWCVNNGCTTSKVPRNVRVSISGCLNGKYKYTAGHKWKYHINDID